MANIGELIVALKANTDDFINGLKKADTAMKDQGVKLDNLKNSFNGLALGGGAVVGAMVLMAKSTMEEDEAIAKLARTVSTSDEQFLKTRETLGKWADEMENKYPYSAEQYAGAIKDLVVKGHVPLDKAMASSTGFLQFMADTGMNSKRALTYLHDEAKKGVDVLGEYSKKAEMTQTPMQKMIVLQNQWGNVMESVGGAVIPILSNMVSGVMWLIEAFNKIPAPVRDIVAQIAFLTAGGVAVVGIVGRLGLGFITMASSAIPMLITAVKGLGVALQFLALNPIGILITALGLIAIALTTNFMGVRDKAVGIITGLGYYFKGLAELVGTVADAMQKAFHLDFAGARDAVVKGLSNFKDDVEKGNQAIVDGWKKSNSEISQSDKDKEKLKRDLIAGTTALLKTNTKEETALAKAEAKDIKDTIKDMQEARKNAYDNDVKEMDLRVKKVRQTNALILSNQYTTLDSTIKAYEIEKKEYKKFRDEQLAVLTKSYADELAKAGTDKDLKTAVDLKYKEDKLAIETDYKTKVSGIDEEITNKKVAENEKIRDNWRTTYEEIGTIFGDAVGKMLVAGGTLKDGLESVWDAMKRGFLKIVKGMIKDYISAWFDAEIAKASAEAVVTKGVSSWKVGAMIAGKMASLSAIDAVIPYAKGGYVTKPTLAMVGEGGEPEYIIPASKMDSVFANPNTSNSNTNNTSNVSKTINVMIQGGAKSAYQIFQELKPYIDDPTSVNRLGMRRNYA